MENVRLQTSVIVDGVEYPINKKGDYEMVLDVLEVLNDESLTENEQAFIALNIFYDFNVPEDMQKAANEMMKFINCGEEPKEEKHPEPPLISWTKDFPLMVAPINRVLGKDIRETQYLHWWTFVAAYMEIGECTFSNIVGIRKKLRKGKPLEKNEQEFYNNNREKINAVSNITEEDLEMLDDF